MMTGQEHLARYKSQIEEIIDRIGVRTFVADDSAGDALFVFAAIPSVQREIVTLLNARGCVCGPIERYQQGHDGMRQIRATRPERQTIA